MTPEEQKQVQNIINARTKLLNEKIAHQEGQLSALAAQLEEKDSEISALTSMLSAFKLPRRASP